MNLKKEKFFQKIKNKLIISFKLTTYKIALISILLALTTLVSLFEIPTFFMSWLTVDFGNTINLLAVLIIKMPYSLLIAIIVPWLRLVLPHFGGIGNPIAELAYMLSTITILLLYYSVYSLFNLIPYWKNETGYWYKRFMIIEIPVAIITCILQALVNTFFNWAFLLDLYGASSLKNILWITFFPYNLFKFTFVLGLFLFLVRPVQNLAKHFNFY